MNIYKSIRVNKWKSWLIIVLFIIFALTVGYVIGEATGYGYPFTTGVFIFSVFYAFGSFFFSDKIVLGTNRAKKIKKENNPELYRIVENLSIASGNPMPNVYVINDPAPNAFATGRDPKHASIAVTTGLQEKLSKIELEGVIAHELSHVKNYDTRLLMITAVLVGFVALLADIFTRSLFWGGIRKDENNKTGAIFLLAGIILAILAPIFASLIQLSVSRKREYLADASGALLTRYPEGLASALEKISSDKNEMRSSSSATAHLFIASPFKEKNLKSKISGLFSTHPPIEERVRILRSM